MSQILAVLALTAAGVGAGVLTAVAISVFPALCAMPPGRYVETHRMFGKGFHPTMPIVFNVGMFSAFALALVERDASSIPFAAGGLALLASQCVSHLGNVPINRRLAVLDPENLPEDWDDPRPRWRFLNKVRASLAVIALALIAAATVVS
ncbi:DUF1772 domain-containing protein [Streptomyces albus subsp. chlorinus]|uniref:anthrone oxygenase family protein n=1 Tax=Streptomyces albus TaxID=1888 RepID=UPI00156F5223|nr:DUF1772 domain-containing protein [Streptomyces albus subsp. chlorinus]